MSTKRKKVLNLKTQTIDEVEVEPRRDTSRNAVYLLSQVSEIGFTIALPIGGGALLGRWLDEKFQSQPKLTLSFIFIGIALAFLNLWYIVSQFSKQRKD